jgi:hypothetical protein
LAYAHQHGVVHRNLKPSNIRMGRVAGRPAPKLLDFGMTRVPGLDPGPAAAYLESLAHTAPEALQGKIDARSDLFSVGTLLYEALTGTRPFEADTPAAVIQRVREEQPAPLDLQLYPELSPAIQDVLSQAMAKDPVQRYGSAEALAEALRAARNPGWTPRLEPPSAVKVKVKAAKHVAPRTGSSSHPMRVAIPLLVAVLVLGSASAYWLRIRHKGWHPAALPIQAALPVQPTAPQAPAQPAPAPAPTPAPTPAPATAGKAHYTSVDQAADALDKDPEGALAFLDQTVAADPSNERAFALRIVALYNLARYSASSLAIRQAREAGHPLWPMALKNPPLRQMLEKDVKDPHLPKRKAPAPASAPAPEPAA